MDLSFLNEAHLPLVIEPSKAMTKEELWNTLESQRDYFKEQLHRFGGILFRNFPLDSASDFEQTIQRLGLGPFIDYIGGDSPRNKIRGSIYTSTEAPPNLKIPLHNELSFVKKYPRHIYFFCEIAPQKDGETIIADARKIYEDIHTDVKKKFESKGLKYVSCYYSQSKMMDAVAKGSHKPWKYVFETEDKEEVEKKCLENEFGFKWNKKDWIEITQVRPATMQHPHTKEPIWFNQAHLFDFNPRFLGVWRALGVKLFYCQKYRRLHDIFYADGSRISRDEMYHIMDVLDKNTIAFPWQKGDVLALDNVLAMHGRNTFKGKRRILTAMTGCSDS